jgi:hypothetical protein
VGVGVIGGGGGLFAEGIKVVVDLDCVVAHGLMVTLDGFGCCGVVILRGCSRAFNWAQTMKRLDLRDWHEMCIGVYVFCSPAKFHGSVSASLSVSRFDFQREGGSRDTELSPWIKEVLQVRSSFPLGEDRGQRTARQGQYFRGQFQSWKMLLSKTIKNVRYCRGLFLIFSFAC